tara:strand:+ start:445 stop:642 length:198 start_codon:yes stop_codon:yes gene_type:complete
MDSIYIHETDTIYSENGEVHLLTENKHIVFNADTLFNDIPALADMALKERKKQEKFIINQIKKIK